MDVRMPDGTVITGVPDDITQTELLRRYSLLQTAQPKEEPSGFFRQAADVPLGIAKGVTSGVRMLSDVFGADNPVSQALKGGEGYLNSLMSAQARNDQQAIAKILKDAEDKGVLDQVLAGVRAFATAPVDMLAQAAGTAIPAIAGGLAGTVLKVAPRVVGGAVGAGMGTGVVKGTIYEETKQALKDAGVSEDQAEARAKLAQSYGGQNLDQILLGTALGGLTAVTGVEPAAVGALTRRILGKQVAEEAGEEAAKRLAREAGQSRLRRAATTGVTEAIPEFLQASQEQIAANLAQQREGLEADTFRGAISAGTMEALAGAGLGAGVGAVTRPEAPQIAPPAPPTPAAPVPPTPAPQAAVPPAAAVPTPTPVAPAVEPEEVAAPAPLVTELPYRNDNQKRVVQNVMQSFGMTPDQVAGYVSEGRIKLGKDGKMTAQSVEQLRVIGQIDRDSAALKASLKPEAAPVAPAVPEVYEAAPDFEGVEFKPLEQPPLPKTTEELEIDKRIGELEKRYSALTARAGKGESLRQALVNQLSESEVKDIGDDPYFKNTFQIKTGRGKVIADLVSDGVLDPWLPENLRILSDIDSPEVIGEKEKAGADFIKEKLRNRDFRTAAADMEARQIDEELALIRQDIEREADLDTLRDIVSDIYEEEITRGFEPSEPEYAAPSVTEPAGPVGEEPFALTQETEQERAVREAEAERTREARELKAIADREREAFTLAPEPVEREMPPTGDMFGARGLTEQPARAAKPQGAAVLVQRQLNAQDRFVSSAVEQFGLTEDQALDALNTLIKEKIVKLDPVDGQAKLKDGRFWDKEVLLRAAAAATKPTRQAPPKLTPPADFVLKEGRNEQVVLAARQLEKKLAAAKTKEERIAAKAEYDQYVNYYTPIAPIPEGVLETPLDKAGMERVLTAKQKQKINVPITDGTPVGLRMDLPALKRGKKLGINGSVVSIHKESKPENVGSGENLSYAGAAHIVDAQMAIRREEEAFDVAKSEEGSLGDKKPQQTVEGKWVNTPQEEIFARVKQLMNDPAWTQVSLDPLRHSFFYDRKTLRPVLSADEVYQVGRFVLAKNAKFGERNSFLYRLAPKGTKGNPKAAIEKLVNRIKERWVNAPPSQVVQSISDLPPDLRAQIEADGVNPKGAYYPPTGTVYLIADNISGSRDAFVTLAHEALGHFGLRSILGERYSKVMNDLFKSNAEVRRIAKQYMKRGLDQNTAVEEVLAEAIEDRIPPDTALGRAIQVIKNILRQIAKTFGVGTLSDAEVQSLLDGARDYVIEGRSAAAPTPAAGRAVYALGRKKPAAPQRTQAGQDALNVVSALGRQAEVTPDLLDKANSILKDVKENPSLTKEAVKKATINFLDKFETKVFSTSAALDNAIRREINKTTMDNEEKIGALLSISSNQAMHADALASLFIQYGSVQYNPELYKYEAVDSESNFVNLSKALDDITVKYGLTKEEAERVGHTYFEARRLEGLSAANQTAKKKVFIHMTPEQIAAGLDLGAKIPELERVAEIWNGIRQNAANILVDSGLWSPEEADILLSNIEYVPFYRDDQLEQGKGPKEFLRGLEVQAKDKKIKGSDMPVADIFDNMVRWTQYAVKRSVMNKLAQAKVNAAVEFGLATPVEEKNKGPNSVRVWENGEAKFYDMQDPLFMEAFAGLESVSLPIWKFFAKMSNFLRQSVVLYPLFSVAQVPQDSFAAVFSSGLKTRYALTIPARAVKEFINTLLKSSKTHEELRRVGAVGIRDFTSAVAREDAEVSAGLKPTPGIFNKVKNVLEHISMASDNAVRQAVYSASIDQGLSSAEAIEKAFAIINFRNKGGSPTIRMLGQVVPFFNAYLAAQHVAIKTVSGVGISPSVRSEALKTLAATTGAVAALSLIYAILMDDEEEYNDTPSVMRDRLFIVPGTGLTIPIRTDIFSMPKILTEHMYMLMTDQGMADGRKFRDSMKSALGNMIFGPTPVPQAIKPLVEVAVNYNFFQGRPLIGTFQKGLELERQFNDSTSELAKIFGQTGLVSPIAVDHVMRGMFGSLGGLIMFMTNPILHNATDVPRPEMSLREMAAALPGTSGFISRPFATGLKNDFYVLRDEVAKAVNTYNDIKKRSPMEIEEFLAKEDNVTRVGMQKTINKITKDLTSIRQQISLITNLPASEMSGAEKRELINELKQIEQELMRSIDIKELRRMANL